MYTLIYKNKTIRNLSKENLSDWIAYLNYKNIKYIIK